MILPSGRWLTIGEATVLFLWVVAMGSQCWQGKKLLSVPCARYDMLHLGHQHTWTLDARGTCWRDGNARSAGTYFSKTSAFSEAPLKHMPNYQCGRAPLGSGLALFLFVVLIEANKEVPSTLQTLPYGLGDRRHASARKEHQQELK